MDKAISILVEHLEAAKFDLSSHQKAVTVYEQKACDARDAVMRHAKEIVALEKAIVALGGEVPAHLTEVSKQ